MGHIYNGLGKPLKTLVPYLIKNHRQKDGRRKGEDQIYHTYGKSIPEHPEKAGIYHQIDKIFETRKLTCKDTSYYTVVDKGNR
jgi:hypothetical protein